MTTTGSRQRSLLARGQRLVIPLTLFGGTEAGREGRRIRDGIVHAKSLLEREERIGRKVLLGAVINERGRKAFGKRPLDIRRQRTISTDRCARCRIAPGRTGKKQ